MIIRRHIVSKFLLLLFCSLMTGLALGFTPAVKKSDTIVHLDQQTDNLSLSKNIWYLEDPEGVLKVKDLISSDTKAAWAPNKKENINFGYTKSVYWATTLLQNDSPEEISRVLEIAYNVLDRVDLYFVSEKGIRKHISLGDLKPFNERVYHHRDFIIPFSIPANTAEQIVIRVKSGSSIQLPLKIWKQQTFHEQDQESILILGLYYGTMLVMLLYNLFIFVVVKLRNYLYYVVWVIGIGGFMMSFNGIGYQFLWPNSPWWNDQAIVFFLSIANIFGMIFTYEFLDLRRERVKLGKIVRFFTVPPVLILLFLFLLPYEFAIRAVIISCLFAIGIIIPVAVLRWLDGYHPARYFTMAWMVLLIGSAFLAFNKFGLVPRNSLTEYSSQIGSALEVMLLSFALADRMNMERKMREDAQREAIDAQQASVESLTRYQELYDNAMEGLFTLASSGHFTTANPSTARILKLPQATDLLAAESGLPRNFVEFFPTADSYFQGNLNKLHLENIELEGLSSTGEKVWVMLTAQAVLNNDGSIRYIDGSILDITASKSAA